MSLFTKREPSIIFPRLKSLLFSSRCYYKIFWFNDLEIFWIYLVFRWYEINVLFDDFESMLLQKLWWLTIFVFKCYLMGGGGGWIVKLVVLFQEEAKKVGRRRTVDGGRRTADGLNFLLLFGTALKSFPYWPPVSLIWDFICCF